MDSQEQLRQIASSVKRVGRRVFVNRPVFEAALLGETPDPAAPPKLITIPQLVEEQPGFTEPAARQLIARAEKAVADSPAAA